jgi:hypothetical protein
MKHFIIVMLAVLFGKAVCGQVEKPLLAIQGLKQIVKVEADLECMIHFRNTGKDNRVIPKYPAISRGGESFADINCLIEYRKNKKWTANSGESLTDPILAEDEISKDTVLAGSSRYYLYKLPWIRFLKKGYYRVKFIFRLSESTAYTHVSTEWFYFRVAGDFNKKIKNM